MRLAVLAAAAGIAIFGAVPASAAGADKLYVLDCGHMSAADQSRWSPGVNVGVPIELSDNCYLIHHPQGWFLWDTGLPDALAATPEGTTSANGALHVKRPKTLAGQLDELGVKAADIKAMAISHTHPARPYRQCRAVPAGHALCSEGRIRMAGRRTLASMQRIADIVAKENG